ncbi:hypothetical protein U9M48_005159 [Paspalum notatum var. saurae]|uniref:Reverse transcriptase n=1 Tax=Paspalum notatum var. saurae TaxID=547442 RepID=A0AAQ3PWA4_PASNO
MMNPVSLEVAMNLARSYERREQVVAASQPPSSRSFRRSNCILPTPSGPPLLPAPSQRPDASSAASAPARSSTSTGRTVKRLSPDEMEDRRRQGLCFNCDEPYSRGHNRVYKHLIFLDLAEADDDAATEDKDESKDPAPAEPIISLHAIAGVTASQTMQVPVVLGATTMAALIDSGSTHNFISESAAAKTGLAFTPRAGMRVAVANGEHLPCVGVLQQASFSIHSAPFTTDIFVLPLAGFDMVLGTQWLATLGPILWDFSNLTMVFWHHNGKVEWHGLTGTPPPRLLLLTGDDVLAALLSAFDDLFAEPRGLPPARDCDHRIHLLPGTTPVAVRPYRYPALHKDELERQCRDMEQRGLIHRIVDELLDELRGATFFTKLDLRSGYHQVRMAPNDVHKTAFRTHEGLYEFLVMPFGLSNAPATFQALMNAVLRPFLRRFILVFFDDILIYSRTWLEHLHHLRAVFSALRDNNLVLKRSKCSFGLPSGYGEIAGPLNDLLKKNGFGWSERADAAFQQLKQALTTAPVLTLLDFHQPFILECDASGTGCGAILHQGAGPVAFFSRAFAPRHYGLAAYERELIGLVQAVRHWRPYLWGRAFLIKTDHCSLKYLLDQRLATIPQHHWVSKLLGFDFRVEYRPGRSNVVADALSRRDADDTALLPSRDRRLTCSTTFVRLRTHIRSWWRCAIRSWTAAKGSRGRSLMG